MQLDHSGNCPHLQDENLGCDCGVIPTVHPKDAEIARLRTALETIERAKPHHYQMCFEDHASFAQRLKAMARAALQPTT